MVHLQLCTRSPCIAPQALLNDVRADIVPCAVVRDDTCEATAVEAVAGRRRPRRLQIIHPMPPTMATTTMTLTMVFPSGTAARSPATWLLSPMRQSAVLPRMALGGAGS